MNPTEKLRKRAHEIRLRHLPAKSWTVSCVEDIEAALIAVRDETRNETLEIVARAVDNERSAAIIRSLIVPKGDV